MDMWTNQSSSFHPVCHGVHAGPEPGYPENTLEHSCRLEVHLFQKQNQNEGLDQLSPGCCWFLLPEGAASGGEGINTLSIAINTLQTGYEYCNGYQYTINGDQYVASRVTHLRSVRRLHHSGHLED